METASVLKKIIGYKKEEVEALKGPGRGNGLRDRASDMPPCRDFLGGLKACPHVPVIAEIKKASPSAGTLRGHVDVPSVAAAYRDGGAACLSVLTDRLFFNGSPGDLPAARQASGLPILRKDFTIDPVQIYESRVMGADAVLLIVAALEKQLLADLFGLALEQGLTPLVEVHNETELAAALELSPPLLGINNRNLSTLKVDIETSVRLNALVPPGVFTVCESGVSGPADIHRLKQAGLDAFLIGTLLMRSSDPRSALASLCGVGD